MSARGILVGAVLVGLMGCGGGKGPCTTQSDCSGGAVCNNGTCVSGSGVGLQVESISPQSGPVGTVITIRGTQFSPTAEANSVVFGTAPALVTSSTATELEVTAPASADGTVPVSVTVNGETADNKPTFTYQADPAAVVVAGITPQAGPAGTSVTISGANFSATAAENSVTFGSVAASVSSATASELKVTAPAGSGTVAVSVATAGKTAANKPSFNYQSDAVTPAVTSISPQSGFAGTTVTITGANFGAGAAANQVTFGSAAATVTSASATELRVTAPPGTGTVVVIVTVGGRTAANKPSFGYQQDIQITKLASLPADGIVTSHSAIGEYAAFALGSKGYVINSSGTNYQYDPGTNTWTRKTGLDESGSLRQGAYGFAIGDLGYVAFGYQHDDVRSYDPGSDSWSELSVQELLISAPYRPYSTAVVVGDRLFVGNGAYPYMFPGQIGAGTISWHPKVAFPDPAVSTPLCFAFSDVAYWGGTYLGNNQSATTFYRLEPSSETWVQIGPLPQTLRRYFQSYAFVIGNKGYALNDGLAWIFSRETETWRSVAFSGMEPNLVASFTIGDTAYLLFDDGGFYGFKELKP